MLINTIDQLQEFVNVTEGFSIDNLKPHHRRTVRRYILPYLDSATYDTLYAQIQGSTLAGEYAKIAPVVQSIWANFAMLLALPQIIARMSDNGMMKVQGDNERPAFKYEVKDLKQSYIESGYEAIEELLELMESIIKEDATKFVSWQTSPQCSISREHFLSTLAQAELHLDLGGSRRKLISMRPYMRNVEQLTIQPTLGAAYFEALKEKMRNNILLEKEVELIEAIRPVIAHTTFAKALAFNLFQLTPEGVLVLTADEEQGYNSAEPAPNERVSAVINEHQKQARTFMAELRKFLEANAADLEGYTPPATPPSLNDPSAKTFWL